MSRGAHSLVRRAWIWAFGEGTFGEALIFTCVWLALIVTCAALAAVVGHAVVGFLIRVIVVRN